MRRCARTAEVSRLCDRRSTQIRIRRLEYMTNTKFTCAAAILLAAGSAFGQSFTEGFNDITVLPGWDQINNSFPIGLTNWFQGNAAVFAAHQGDPGQYLGANY